MLGGVPEYRTLYSIANAVRAADEVGKTVDADGWQA
jgi:hypothetical protein